MYWNLSLVYIFFVSFFSNFKATATMHRLYVILFLAAHYTSQRGETTHTRELALDFILLFANFVFARCQFRSWRLYRRWCTGKLYNATQRVHWIQLALPRSATLRCWLSFGEAPLGRALFEQSVHHAEFCCLVPLGKLIPTCVRPTRRQEIH